MESDKRVRGERRLYMFVDMRDESRTSTDNRGVFTGQRDNSSTEDSYCRNNEMCFGEFCDNNVQKEAHEIFLDTSWSYGIRNAVLVDQYVGITSPRHSFIYERTAMS